MGTQSASSSSPAVSRRGSMFAASCIALITAAMVFAIRADILGAIGDHFGLTEAQVGWVFVGGFWGFTISIAIGGMVCDRIGMRGVMILAFIGHLTGTLMTIFASGYAMLAVGTLLVGLGHGFVEAAINPLVATIYPDRKTEKLNVLHAWWPGGIVLGSVLAFFLTKAGFTWQHKMWMIMIPTVIYGIWFIMLKLPQTERVQSGVSTGDMWKQAARPLFLVFLFCMLLTAATELGTNQWIGEIMIGSGIQEGILILAWVSGIMLIGRLFAGPVVKAISPVGLLLAGAVVTMIGLFAMSMVSTMGGALIASFIYAIGICYFWPTMLGVTAERFPAGGALLLGLMGAAGMASAGVAQPIVGGLLGEYGASGALQRAAILPLILLVIFAVIYLRDRATGGYKVVQLAQFDASAPKIEVKEESTTAKPE